MGLSRLAIGPLNTLKSRLFQALFPPFLPSQSMLSTVVKQPPPVEPKAISYQKRFRVLSTRQSRPSALSSLQMLVAELTRSRVAWMQLVEMTMSNEPCSSVSGVFSISKTLNTP